MIRFLVLLTMTLLAACAAQPDTRANDAVADFIAVSELEELSKVRMWHQSSYKQITDRYIILKSHQDRYLVEFRRRCHELDQVAIRPDIRHEANVLRPGFDTIRGCLINRMYAVDDAQAQELEQLGKAPGD